MDDGKGILGDALGEIVGIGKQAAGEVITTAGQVPVKGLQSLAGATMTPQELAQKKLEEEQKRQGDIAAVRSQLSQQIESSRGQRTQLEDVRRKGQELPKATPGLSPLGAGPLVDIGHKLLERKSDKRHG